MKTVQCPLLCPPVPGIVVKQKPGRSAVRDEIASLCNHMVKVHNAGSKEAWSFALERYPVDAQLWGQEILDRALDHD